MIRTNENTTLTRAEYRELAEKVSKEIIDKLPDDASPLILLSTTIDLAIALKAMEVVLFGEEEK